MTDAILTLLAQMGGSPDEIALTLAGKAICARRGSTTFHNPIVRFINRNLEVGGRMHIALGSDVLTIAREGSSHTVQLPAPVCAFLARFHAGEFPQLEQT